MKNKIILLLVIACLLVPINPFVAASYEQVEITTTTQEQVVTVQILTPMVIPETKDVQANFVGLTAQAVELGLNEAGILGRAQYQKLANQQTRVKIIWHSIGISASHGSTISETLSPVLVSQFTTTDKRVEPNTQVAARGNLEAVTQKFLTLKEKASEDKTPRTLVAQAEDKEEEERDNKADEFTPTASGSAVGGGSATYNPDSSEFNSDLITTTWEACAVRIAAAESRVYLQHRPVDKNEAGEVVDSGSCVDTGTYVDAVKEYGGDCADLPDFTNQKVYEQYIEKATVEGTEVIVRNCTTDFNRFYSIQSNTADCGYKHDFVAGQSIEQEILYYVKGSETIDLTACQDSNRAYAHYETELTCDYIIDDVNKLAFKQTRLAFTDGAAQTQYASDCAPVPGDTGKAIEEEYCAEKYEHDFINNVSYYRTKSYYLDDSAQPVYITACARSTTSSFPHISNTDTCSVTNDDALLQTQFFALKQIDTPEDGLLEIAPCVPTGVPVAYVYQPVDEVDEFTSNGTWTAPAGVSEIFVTIIGAGAKGETGSQGNLWYDNGVLQQDGGNGGRGARGGVAGQLKESVRLTSFAGTHTVTIGPSNGASSSFGSLVVAAGGSGYIAHSGTYGNGGIIYKASRTAAKAGKAGTVISSGAGGGGGGIGTYGSYGHSYYQYAVGAGGGGGNGGQGGYGTVSLAGTGLTGGTGYTPNSFVNGGTGGKGGYGGKGYGAGGGGGGGGGGSIGGQELGWGPENRRSSGGAGGNGAKGYCKVEYQSTQYLRGDGSTYAP